jgi:hypothetical protein
MVVETFSYPGEAYWYRRSPDVSTDLAISKIASLFDNGLPFYTKEDMQSLDQQLDKVLCHSHRIAGERQQVTVKGLDGVKVAFDIERGRVLSSDKSSSERVLYVQTYYACQNDSLIR